MSTDKTAAEIALDEIAAACGCPPWEYPGQVVRDVLGLVKANETLTASLATVTRKRDEARRERDDHARFLYAAGYTPCNSEACNCGSWHGGHVEELRARLRHVTQMLVGAVGAGGPMSAEAAAEKAVATIMERDELRAALETYRAALSARDQRTTQFCAEAVDARRAERAAIVAWLRERAEERTDDSLHADTDAIERGDHLPTDRSPK